MVLGAYRYDRSATVGFVVRCGGALVVGRYAEQVPVVVALLRVSPLTLLCRLSHALTLFQAVQEYTQGRLSSLPILVAYQVRVL